MATRQPRGGVGWLAAPAGEQKPVRALGTGSQRVPRIRVGAEKLSAGDRGASVHFHSATQQVPDAVKSEGERRLTFVSAHADSKNERSLVRHLIPAR